MFATLSSAEEGHDQQPGYLGGVVARSVATNRALVLSLWTTADHAGEVYAVTDLHTGTAVGQPPARLSCLFFDGPRGAAQVAADDRSNRERIVPAIIAVPGLIVGLTMRAADGAFVIAALATDQAVFEEIAQRSMATGLLPGEDPALLRGPERFEDGRVEVVDLGILLPASVSA